MEELCIGTTRTNGEESIITCRSGEHVSSTTLDNRDVLKVLSPQEPDHLTSLALSKALTTQPWSDTGRAASSTSSTTTTTVEDESHPGRGVRSRISRSAPDVLVERNAAVLERLLAKVVRARVQQNARKGHSGVGSAEKSGGGMSARNPKASNVLQYLTPAVRAQVRSFVFRISTMYRGVLFHSFEHASHVLLSMNSLVHMLLSASRHSAAKYGENQEHAATMHRARATSKSRRKQHKAKKHFATYGISSDPACHFALVFAALVHDVDHQGVPNRQLVSESDPLAIRYNDRSVAEQHSLSVAFATLSLPEFDDLRKAIVATPEEGAAFRTTVIDLVMATDIASPERIEIGRSRWKEAFLNAEVVEHTLEERFQHTTSTTTAVSATATVAKPTSATSTNAFRIQRSAAVAHGGSDVALNSSFASQADEAAGGCAPLRLGEGPRDHSPSCMASTPPPPPQISGAPRETVESLLPSRHRLSVESTSGSLRGSLESLTGSSRRDSMESTSTESIDMASCHSRRQSVESSCSSAADDDLSHSRHVSHSHSVAAPPQTWTSAPPPSVDAKNAVIPKTPSTCERRHSCSSCCAPHTVTSPQSPTTGSTRCSGPYLKLGIRRTLTLHGSTIEFYPEPTNNDALKASSVLDQLMQAADVAHTMQSFDVFVTWNARLYEELYFAIRNGRGTSMGCDVDQLHANWYRNQINFFDNYVLPLAGRLKYCGVFCDLGSTFESHAAENRSRWMDEGKKLSTKIHRDASAKWSSTV